MTETSKSYTIRQYPPNPLLDNGVFSDNDLTYTSSIAGGTDISGTQYGGGSYIVKYSSYKSSSGSQVTGATSNYPPSPMTASSTTINNITYRACTSDSFNYNSFDGWRAFAKIGGGTAWTSGSSYNQDGSLSAQGVTFGNDTNYRGIYVGIDMGEEIIIKSYHLKQGWSPLGNGNRNPKNWKIYATNNIACWNSAGRGSLNTSSDYGWVAIDTRSNETSYGDTTLFTLNNSTTYRFYALQINATRSGDQYGGYCELSEWELFGSQNITNLVTKPWIILKNDPAYWSKIDISSSQPNWAGNYELVAPYSYLDNSYLVNNFTGDYVTIKLPYKIYLTKYVLCSTINKLKKAPQHFSIYGSINGVIWNKIVEKHLTSTSYINTQIPNSTNSTGYYTDNETKSTVAYDYYGIVVNKLIGPLDASDNNLSFSLWNVYGTNDLKERSVFEFGVVTDTSKIIGSSLKDGLIKANNSNIFIKSGNVSTPALTIGTNNRVAVGKNIASEAFDVSGSLIANEYRIKNQNYPVIDASSNIAVSGNTDISGNLTLNNNKFVVNASTGNLSVAGTLDISKNININNGKTTIDSSGNIKSQGNFDLSSNININNYVLADASGSVIMNNTLDISNNATLRSSLDIKGNIKSSAFTTNSSLNKVSIRNTSVDPSYNFHVSGSTRLEGNLDVDGNIIIVDTVQQTSEQFIINNDGNTVALTVKQIGAQPIVDLRDDGKSVFYLADNGLLGLGTTTPSCTVDVSGSCFVQQTLDVSGNLNIGGNTYLSENIQFNDTLDVSRNVNINNKFFVDPSGNIDICGNMLIYGYLISNGNNANSGGFQQDGNAIINGELRVLYSIDISQNLRVLDTFIVDASGNIKSKGQFDLSNNLRNGSNYSINTAGDVYSAGNIDISKNFNINNGVFSADVSGNIIVNGFIDISKNLYVNGNKFTIDQNGNITAMGTIDVSQNLRINTDKFIVDASGNIKSVGNLNISNNFIINNGAFKIDNNGNISSQNNFDVSGNMSINGSKMTVSNTGNIKSAGKLDISKNFSINTDKFTVDSSGNTIAKGNIDISNNLTIGNNTFNVDASGNIKSSGTLDVSKNLKIGNTLLTVDHQNKRVGINTTTPEYSLDVSGQIVTNKTMLGSTYNIVEDAISKFVSPDTNGVKIQMNNTNITPTAIGTDEYYYAFTSTTDSYTFTCTQDITCDVLIIGGGGGGAGGDGNDFISSSGGGGGQVKYYTNKSKSWKTGNGMTFTKGTYTLTVGSGGTPSTSIYNNGNNGSSSSILYNGNTFLTSGGGGGGGGTYNNGESAVGGGGGGIVGGTSSGGGGNGGISISQEQGAGGGGGADVSGNNGGNASYTSHGGLGVNIDILDTIVGYGGGGGGGGWRMGGQSTATHGGGAGGRWQFTKGEPGTVNTGGGGGGGGGYQSAEGGNGGSGIIIIRFKYPLINSIDISTAIVKMNNANVTPTNITSNEYYYPFTSTSANYTFTCTQDTTCDILMIGGGGGGSDGHGGGGGAGSLVFVKSAILPTGTYTFTVGSGGSGGGGGAGNKGGDTKIILNGTNILVAEGGGAGGGGNPGGNGGSGGGGDGWTSNGSGGDANAGLANNPGSSIVTYNGVTGIKYGNNGGVGAGTGGGGGGAGTPGIIGNGVSPNWSFGGEGRKDAIINSTTYDFVTVFGTTLYGTNNDNNNVRYFAGGGGGGRRSNNGGKGGGGSGGGYDGVGSVETGGNKNITPGVANTGSGGGGGGDNGNYPGAAGGSGIILLKLNYPYIKSYSTVYNNNATFGYRDTNESFIPSIVQLNTGQTYINSLSQYINFNFGNDNKCKMDASGNLILNGDIFIYSDGRIKENVTTITSALDKVNEMSGITYNIINKPRRQIGVVAQEVEKVLPEVIKEEDGVKTVAYPNMVGLLIEALKELNDRVDQTI